MPRVSSLLIRAWRVARTEKPLASCEVVVITARPDKATGYPTNITFRWVTPNAFKVRNGIKIVEGRMFTPGLFEVIVGKKIADRVQGMEVGSIIPIQRKNWKVVGLFTADGSSFESEIWGDYDAMGAGHRAQWRMRVADRAPDQPRGAGQLRQGPARQSAIPVAGGSEKQYYENLACTDRGRADGAGRLCRGGDGHWRGVWRDEHDVCHRLAAHPRDWHAARAGLLTLQHPDFVCDGIGAARPDWRSAGLPGGTPDERLHRGANGTNAFSEMAFAFRVYILRC